MMQKSFSAAAVLALAAVLTAGCDLVKPDDYFPMGVGSSWSYRDWATVQTPTAGLDTTSTGTTEILVTGKRQLAAGGEVVEFVMNWVRYTRFPSPDTISGADTSYYRDAGNCILSYASLSDTVPDTLLVLPLAANRSWHSGGSTVTVEEQEDLTVPAGTYRKAWRLALDVNDLVVKQWYGNHAGLLKVFVRGEPMPGYVYESYTELVQASIKD